MRHMGSSLPNFSATKTKPHRCPSRLHPSLALTCGKISPRQFLGSSAPVRPASYFPAPAVPCSYPGSPMGPRMMLLMTLSGGDSGEGTKLYVLNLDADVSNEDIKLPFSGVGALKRCGIHCYKSGNSLGTAEVLFFRPEDAMAAVRR